MNGLAVAEYSESSRYTFKMSRRNPMGMTGTNNVPLGTRRRFGDRGGDDEESPPPPPSMPVDTFPIAISSLSDGAPPKRGRSPVRASEPEVNADGTRKRKKKNRWGDAVDNKAAGLVGLPTKIEAAMTSEQLEAYTLHLRIEEITQKLRINDVVPADGDRSPSPPPQYDNMGRRINTREYRYRKRLEDERHKLVEKAMKAIPNYHPPSDYRRPTKTQEKIYVPVNDYPEINFIGLLIGPRGNTLKKMESQSGAKIAIRGKGSVKEGKGRSDAAHASNQEEDLHCLIMADSEDKVNKAKALINEVIETAASIPEGQNTLKRNQLRELAALNGTLRDDENQACQNCKKIPSIDLKPFILTGVGGQIGHRKYDCPEQRNFTASIICRVCGNAGHMARDCPDRQRGASWRNDDRGPGGRGGFGGNRPGNIGDAVDREYENFLAAVLLLSAVEANNEPSKLDPAEMITDKMTVGIAAVTEAVTTAVATIKMAIETSSHGKEVQPVLPRPGKTVLHARNVAAMAAAVAAIMGLVIMQEVLHHGLPAVGMITMVAVAAAAAEIAVLHLPLLQRHRPPATLLGVKLLPEVTTILTDRMAPLAWEHLLECRLLHQACTAITRSMDRAFHHHLRHLMLELHLRHLHHRTTRSLLLHHHRGSPL
ncbi:hypothetical protein Dda_6405 [Drechslerella dactyloides]|uniref:Branchpoint-bridging protein n=1 Tax=Drechslerella dactyloides TaxID=74499 RepID=A0AAD6ITH4_DREDA|nr:hypothetical protein Dda_6405 [Drechslerella dactyloides]